MAKIEQIKLKDVIYTLGANAEDISGTVPINKGGTGETSANSAINTLLSAMNTSAATGQITDDMRIATTKADGSDDTTWYGRKVSYLWNYIKSKADNAYSSVSHTHKAGDITSGTLPVNRGGTGRTTFAKNAVLVGNDNSDINAVTNLSVSQGGTGVSSFTDNSAIISGSTTTGAFTTRAITNNTSTAGAISASTNLVTMNTLKNALNRTTSVAAADTNYTTVMARGISLSNTISTPKNGAILGVYL